MTLPSYTLAGEKKMMFRKLGWIGLIVTLMLAACGRPQPVVAPGGVPTPRQPPLSAPGMPTPRPTEPGATPVTPTPILVSEEDLPHYTIEIDGQTLDGVVGGYCWPVPPPAPAGYNACTTVIPPTFDAADRVLVTLGQPIDVTLEEPFPDTLDISVELEATMGVYDHAQLIPQGTSFRWTPEVDPGDYDLVLYAKWFDTDADLAVYFPLTFVAGADMPTATP